MRTSGEIPEVAMYSSIYYMTEDPDGPNIELHPDDVKDLKIAVIERYQEIILRDLAPENRDKGLYRGLARSVANWQRLTKFCAKENLDPGPVRSAAAKALIIFMRQETKDVMSGVRTTCINCSSSELEQLIDQLGVYCEELPGGWREILIE